MPKSNLSSHRKVLGCLVQAELSLVISYSKPKGVFSPLYTSILKTMLLEVEYIGCDFFFPH